ncbi:phospholipase D-like domain-containing protein [Paenibacillus dakarensis]|uniref:phospholipase D-like domain-containing protein n=1 Tax=Paenibacillus dakarensis TaxID=1527293 RepID=UPI0006D5A69E|nr:phospholipase D-like domain-containing protein [Paenibacillus dakarensis]
MRIMSRLITWSLLVTCVSIAGCSSRPVEQETAKKNQAPGENVSSSPSVQVKFTQEGDHPEELIIQLINGTASTLDIAIYSINYEPIVEAVINAAERGVNVRMITDLSHAEEKAKQKKALELLQDAGVPIKVNSHDGKMHLKMIIADGNKVETGSFNYLKSSVEENDDVAVFIEDDEVGRKFQSAFNNLWDNTERFKEYK